MTRRFGSVCIACRVAATGLLALGLCGPAVAERPDWPYLDPRFQRLMEAVTFHAGFDAGIAPEMAEGPAWGTKVFAPQQPPEAKPQFAEGLVGKALVLGSGSAVYPRAGNVLLERRGALALWIKPEGWLRPRDGNCVFAMTTNSTFYLERQGPDRDDDGRVRRQEGILYIAGVPGVRSATLNGGPDWENGQWYLLVANWSWPTMELSVSGGPFQVQSLAEAPGEKTFGDLVLGDRSGHPRGLLDEVFAFRRPLTLDEVQLLWRLGEERQGKK
jgi:hypothetical protein